MLIELPKPKPKDRSDFDATSCFGCLGAIAACVVFWTVVGYAVWRATR